VGELRDILTVVGSLLGTIAFFQNLLKPLTEFNRSRWKERKEIITEDDFRDLEFGIDTGHRVSGVLDVKLGNLVHAIESHGEVTQFVFVNAVWAHPRIW
jgi:hypothetical protein